MKIKRLLAFAVAAVATVSLAAVNAFAVTFTMDEEYPGAWNASRLIPKSELVAIGGDVKVVLTIELKEPVVGTHNHLAKPFDNAVEGWPALTKSFTSDTAIAKEEDGYFVFADGQTSVEFVIPESVIAGLSDSGMGFQVCDAFITLAELSPADGPEGEIRYISNEQSGEIMEGKSYEEVTGKTSVPASDGDSDSAKTGSIPAALLAAVMAVSGVTAAVSSKRK